MRVRSSDSKPSDNRRRTPEGGPTFERPWLLAAIVVASLGFIIWSFVDTFAQVTVPFPNFTLGTTADPTQVNANFAALSNQALNRTGSGSMTGTLTTQTLTPSADATYDVGPDNTHRYRTANFSGALNAASGTYTGTSTAALFSGSGASLTNLAANQLTTGLCGVARGCTGLDGSAAANGALLIGNGAGYTLATLTGASLLVTNASGSITLTPNTRVLDKTTTEQDVVSSTTETSVWSFSVPGGTLSTSNTLRVSLIGNYFNNTGSSQNLFVSVKYGGTIIAGGPSGTGAALGGGNYATDANRHAVYLQTTLNANGATNSQRSVTNIFVGTATATETDWGTNVTMNHAMKSGLAIDSTGAQTMTITVQHGSNSANLSFKRFGVVLELLQ